MVESVPREPVRRAIQTPDGLISALDFGDPTATIDLVFLHANGFNAQSYREALGRVSPDMRILAPDLRGHGLTELAALPRDHRSWSVFARDLLALMDALSVERVTLAGHSLGATSALLAAGMAPTRAAGLVLFEPVILPWPLPIAMRLPGSRGLLVRNLGLARRSRVRRAEFPTREAALASYRGYGGFSEWSDAALADYVETGFVEVGDHVSLACSPAWETATYAAQAHDPYSALRRTSAPIHMLRAERGSTCRMTGLDRLVKRRPDFVVETVAGTDHFLPIVRPDVTRRALLAMSRCVSVASSGFAPGVGLL